MNKSLSDIDKLFNEWVYNRLIKRAEGYIKDAKSSSESKWHDCTESKILNANFCLTLAEHIRTGIQEF